jgi:hypothetical protein
MAMVRSGLAFHGRSAASDGGSYNPWAFEYSHKPSLHAVRITLIGIPDQSEDLIVEVLITQMKEDDKMRLCQIPGSR